MPVSGLEALRMQQFVADERVQFSTTTPLRNGTGVESIISLPAKGLALEAKIDFEFSIPSDIIPTTTDIYIEFGLRFRINDAGDSYTAIGLGFYVNATGVSPVVVLDCLHSGGSTPTRRTESTLPGERAAQEESNSKHTMSVFIDHSMIEVFAEEGASASTLRVYPPVESVRTALYCRCTEKPTVALSSAPEVLVTPLEKRVSSCENVCENLMATVSMWEMGSIWVTSPPPLLA
jgi:hypothetical protein